MEKRAFKYVYGPVPSRRLGHSLGVDLIPFKTCTYDCIYCQLGRTTIKTPERKSFADLNHVLAEVSRKIKSKPLPDYITLSGSGEPTLYSDTGPLINELKKMTGIPVVVITNGSLLWEENVQSALENADLVIPSLDAGSAATFNRVNRPHPDITFKKMLDGLTEFRSKFSGQIWLEIMLLEGITAKDDEVGKIISQVKKIHPDKVQLNTVIRPAAENYARSVPKNQMEKFAGIFGADTEVIADFHHTWTQAFSASRDEVLNLLKCRPCTFEDMVSGLGISHNELLKHLDYLIEKRMVVMEKRNGRIFYLRQIPYETAGKAN